MTFAELLFWILIAIIAYFLLKAGLVILVIVIVLLVLYFIFSNANKKPVYNYEGYHPLDPEIIKYGIVNLDYDGVNDIRLDPKPYWYIPVHEYLDEKQNYIYPMQQMAPITMACQVPQSTSEYCVNKHLKQNDNLETAISKCVVPHKNSPSCLGATLC